MNIETNKIIEQAKKDGWVIIFGEPSVNDYSLSVWDPKGRLRIKQRIKNHNDAYSTALIDMILKDKARENNTKEKMKPTITDPEAAAIYLENFNQLGEAIMHSGGNPFMVLKEHDRFLRGLAQNKIRVTAKYDFSDKCCAQHSTEDIKENNQDLPYVGYWRSKDGTTFTGYK